MKKRYIEHILVSAGFLFLLGFFFRDAFFLKNIFVERDLSRYYYPLRFFAANCAKSGIFPFWNPYIFCGNPLFATLQSCVLYPLSIVYYLGDFAKMFNVFIFLHFYIAGFFTYLFMRKIGSTLPAAFLSAAAFCFSGYMTSVVNLLTTLSAVAWFPLALFCYYNTMKAAHSRRPSLYRNAVFLGVIFTMMFLAGEPSVLYLIAGLFILGSFYFTLEERLEGHKLNISYVAGIAVAMSVFLGLSAFQSLPFLEFVKLSNREGMSFAMAGMWNLPLREAPAIALPFFHDIFKLFQDYWVRQAWLDNYYVGLLLSILALMAVLLDRSKKARAIFIMGLLGFLITLGKETPVFEFLYRFAPGFKAIRYTIRFFFIPVFSLCVLAGMGLDFYIKNINKLNKCERLKNAAFFMLFTSAVAGLVWISVALNFWQIMLFIKKEAVKIALCWFGFMPKLYIQNIVNGESFLNFLLSDMLNLHRALLFLTYFSALFYFGSKKEVRANIFIVPCLIFLVLVDILTITCGKGYVYDIEKFAKPSDNINFISAEYSRLRRAYPDDFNKQLFRISCSPQTAREHAYVPEADFFQGLEASKDRFISNRTAEFSVYDINMYGSIYLKRNSRFMKLIMDKKSKNLKKLLMLSNVRFLASKTEPPVSGFKLAHSNETANLYQSSEYMPRAFLAPKAVVLTDENKIIEKIKEGDFNPAGEVILEEAGATLKEAVATLKGCPTEIAAGQAAAPPKIISYTPNRILIEARVNKGQPFLVLTDTYYPGWKVFVDGKRQRLLRADYIFRAVQLSPGSHIIEFIYSPFSFKVGLLITIFTILIILTYFVYNNIIIRRKLRPIAS